MRALTNAIIIIIITIIIITIFIFIIIIIIIIIIIQTFRKEGVFGSLDVFPFLGLPPETMSIDILLFTLFCWSISLNPED